uniref:Protein KRI1 homolog n=1 Tax=Plectus sambesii TaxID=2011161 RepID=A0A914UYH1_9BILA
MPKKNGAALIDSDEEEAGDNGLHINQAYATRYDNWRRLEEMQKFKDRYGENAELSDSGDSSSSEEPAEWSTEQEKDFLKALSALKSKDPKIYDEQQRFFHEAPASAEPSPDKKAKKTKEKPMFLKDYERKLVVDRGGDISDEDEDGPGPSMGPSYYEKQNALKNELKTALLDEDDDDDDGELLKKRVKTEERQKEEDEDYYDWLKGRKESPDTEDKKALKPLKDIWSDPNLDADERFLRDYLLNKRYDATDSNEVPTYDEIVNDPEAPEDPEEEEEQLERERDFERKYNFRFEEPDQEFIKQFPRTVKESLRRPDERRKKQRDSYKERKEQEKQQKRDEIKQMKTMKRKEIEEKLKKLKAISGDEELPVDMDDLEGDFDPAEYDRKMQKMFNDKYYSQGVEDEEKPQFSDSEGDEDLPNYDEFPIGSTAGAANADQAEENDEAPTASTEDAPGGSKRKRKRKRNSKFAEAVSREKPRFDPSEKTFEEYFNEYYKLDYEDVIGDTTTRFKYRSVPVNDFGLTVEEILNADDRQLNAWASLKKTTQYRSDKEEQYDVQAYQKKAQDVAKKQRVFTSDFGGKRKKTSRNEEDDAEDVAPVDSSSATNATAETSKSRKKKNKKNKNKSSTEGANDAPTSANSSASNAPPAEKKEGSKARRRNKKKVPLDTVSDDRLRAYGVNPNKFRNKLARKQQKTNA